MTQMLRPPGRMLMRTWNPGGRRGLQSHARSLQSECLGFCGFQRSHVSSRLPWGTRAGGTLSQGQRHCKQPPEGDPILPEPWGSCTTQTQSVAPPRRRRKAKPTFCPSWAEKQWQSQRKSVGGKEIGRSTSPGVGPPVCSPPPPTATCLSANLQLLSLFSLLRELLHILQGPIQMLQLPFPSPATPELPREHSRLSRPMAGALPSWRRWAPPQGRLQLATSVDRLVTGVSPAGITACPHLPPTPGEASCEQALGLSLVGPSAEPSAEPRAAWQTGPGVCWKEARVTRFSLQVVRLPFSTNTHLPGIFPCVQAGQAPRPGSSPLGSLTSQARKLRLRRGRGLHRMLLAKRSWDPDPRATWWVHVGVGGSRSVRNAVT